jgi:hypothetical protein
MVGRNNKQMISAKLTIELETLEQIKTLFGSLEPEHSLTLCDGKIELKLMSTGNSLAFDGGLTAEVILSFSIGVASGVVANTIFAAILTGIKKLEINGQRTRPTEKSITQALETIKTMISLAENKKSIKKSGKVKKKKGKR